MRIISAPGIILTQHYAVLELIAQSLLERETLDLKDVDAIINQLEPGLLASLPVKVRTYTPKEAVCPIGSTPAPGDGNEHDDAPKSGECLDANSAKIN